jgi:uncharacterized protein
MTIQSYAFTIGALGCLLIVSACATQTPAASNLALPQVTLPNSEVRTLKSANTGRTYDLYIRLPEEYTANRQYPVLYLLDGQWDFKLLDSIYGGLHYDQFIPELIIVGITYSGDKPDYETLRAIDYTPPGGFPTSDFGDAPKFLAFLKEEVIPLIEKNYQADPAHRLLMGSSYGGLFTLYAMFTAPELFNGYVSASPAVPFGNDAIFKQETDYAKQHKALPVKLFLSVGEIEELAPPVKAFIKVMNDRAYQGLQMETRIIEGERHSGNKPEAFNRGLRFVLQGQR